MQGENQKPWLSDQTSGVYGSEASLEKLQCFRVGSYLCGVDFGDLGLLPKGLPGI